jgi:hypothetical protein
MSASNIDILESLVFCLLDDFKRGIEYDDNQQSEVSLKEALGHICRVLLGKLLRDLLIQERSHRKATIDKFKTNLFLLL